MNDLQLLGGWPTTKEKATGFVKVTLHPGHEDEQTIDLPITDNPDNPDNSLPMGTQKLKEPVTLLQ